MNSIKVLFVSQEITPYLEETNMSTIGRNLPQGIQERGKEIRTFMPRWGIINERRNQLHEVIRLSGMNLVIDDSDHPLIIKVASIQSARMQVYFIDNEDYFHRKNLFSDSKGKFFEDNDERAFFFARGVLETVKKLRWAPDIIHCHGWFSAFLPMLAKRTYKEDPIFAKSKIVYSVYNDAFSNSLNSKVGEKVMLENVTQQDVDIIKTPNYQNIMKLALQFSDGVIYGEDSIEKETDAYIKTIGIPVLPYHGMEEYIDPINQFYDQVLNNSKDDKK